LEVWNVWSFSSCLHTPAITITKVTATREEMNPVRMGDVYVVINESRINGKKMKAGNEVTVPLYFCTQDERMGVSNMKPQIVGVTRNSRRANDNGKSWGKSDSLFW
jgi:hypothetical protein